MLQQNQVDESKRVNAGLEAPGNVVRVIIGRRLSIHQASLNPEFANDDTPGQLRKLWLRLVFVIPVRPMLSQKPIVRGCRLLDGSHTPLNVRHVFTR
jgi:hypothetical protein